MANEMIPTLPGGEPLLGHLRTIQKDPLRSFLKARELGDVTRIPLANRNLYLAWRPEHVKQVLHDPAAFSKQTLGYKALRKLLGNGLVTSEGEFWLRQRRISQPAFHRQKIAHFAEQMVTLTDELLARWEKHGDGPFDVSQEMMALTLRIVGETLMSTDVSATAGEVGPAMGELLHQVIDRVMSIVDFPLWLPTPRNRRFTSSRGTLDRIVLGIIAERRKAGGEVNDLLGMLMSAKDEETGESMSDEQLRDEVMTIFLAGHETTANALSWTYLLLARHPDAMDRMKAEVDEVLGGRAPTFEDLPRLRYTAMVLNEAMRLYPPVWLLVRRAEGDQQLGSATIPSQSFVAIAPYVSHRNPELFPEPEKFDPERLSPEKISALPRYAFFPFSGGPRICIGNNFAMMEGTLILARIAQRFRLRLVEDQVIDEDPALTLRPRHGIQMTLAR